MTIHAQIVVAGLSILLGCYMIIASMDELDRYRDEANVNYYDWVTWVALMGIWGFGLAVLAVGIGIVGRLLVI